MVNNLVGLSIAPIFSALVLTTGLAYLDSTELPAMQDWFASLAIGFLAVFFPVMLAPILGQITTQVGQMVTTAITAGSIVGAVAGQGALNGIQNASNQMSGAAMNMAGMGTAGAAASTFGGGRNIPVPSSEIGKMTSGVTVPPSQNSMGLDMSQPMSFGDKFKTYTKAGLVGAGAGLPAGMIQSATNAMHIPQVGRPIAHDILQIGNLKAAEIGQTAAVNHNINLVGNNMSAMDPAAIPVVTSNAMMPETGTPAVMMMNPGDSLGNMESIDRGMHIQDTPKLRQEYLTAQHKNIPGFNHLMPNVQQHADVKLLEQSGKHPVTAVNMMDAGKIARKEFTVIQSDI